MELLPTLRPLSVGEILDRAFRLYRNHFLVLIGIGAIAFVPITLLQILSQVTFGDAQIVTLLESAFVACLVQGSLAQAIACAYLGESFTIGSAYRFAFRRYGSLWGAIFLEGLAIGVPVALLACGFIVMARASGEAGLIILMVLVLPYAAFLGTRWLVTIPSIVLQGLSAGEGMRRSWDLTAGVFWRVLAISILSYLLTFLITQLPGLALTYGLTYIAPGNLLGPVAELATTGFSLILASPLSMGIIVLLYYDLRVRREGYDLELRAREMSADPGRPV
jgi:hypothetical protein